MKLIDNFLDGITMYRLMLYVLIFLLFIAIILATLKTLPFTPFELLFSAVFITMICWVVNKIFARVFKAPSNLESFFITALILALIITPVKSLQDLMNISLVSVLAMASKYLIAINKKHLFNPAAFAVTLSALSLNFGASWWVGNSWMMVFVLISGLLVVRKVQRFSMILSFFIIALGGILLFSIAKESNLFLVFRETLFNTPILFFAFIMLTEPQTTTPRQFLQIIYGGLVGLFFAPFIHIGYFSLTPEAGLLIGNIFSYSVSPKEKLLLKLEKKNKIASDIYDFVFKSNKQFSFLPGQYLEWTLSHDNPDNRGNRRYFSIASSPTEDNLRIGVKFSPNGSSFKKSLLGFKENQVIVASQLAGDFILPKDVNKKLVFVAGGIGITPFRSMVKYLLDSNEKRDIVLLFSVKSVDQFVYKELFDKADQNLSIKNSYVVGRITSQMIIESVIDYQDRTFYLSGPHSMVEAFEQTLKNMGIPSSQIKVDFFPGYA